jgi:hypothetical protein
LSEQAKIAYLQEKIKEERENARKCEIVSFLMLVAAFAGFTLYFGYYKSISELALGIIGVVGFFLFSLGEYGSNMLKKRYMTELEKLGSKIPTCPKCGKQIPQGSYAFCPFCGASLRESATPS